LNNIAALNLAYGNQTIEAVISNDEEAAVFSFEQPGPCLLLKHKTYTFARSCLRLLYAFVDTTNGQFIEYVEDTFRGDAYTYRTTLNLEPSR